MGDAELLGYSREQLLQMKYIFGKLKGELRFCECGDISTEWEAHLCPLTLPKEDPGPTVTELVETVRAGLPALHQLGPTCHCKSCEAHSALSQLVSLLEER